MQNLIFVFYFMPWQHAAMLQYLNVTVLHLCKVAMLQCFELDMLWKCYLLQEVHPDLTYKP